MAEELVQESTTNQSKELAAGCHPHRWRHYEVEATRLLVLDMI